MKNLKEIISIVLFLGTIVFLTLALIAGNVPSLQPVEMPFVYAFGIMFVLSMGYLVIFYDAKPVKNRK